MRPNSQSAPEFLSNEPWLVLGKNQFHSRLLIGLEQYDSSVEILQILEAANVEVFITTFDLESSHSSLLLSDLANLLPLEKYIWIGTTSFARTADDAITIARILKQSLGIHIIKLDVRTNDTFPNNSQTIEVAKLLLAEGFDVLPFIWPDPLAARELEQIGCSALRLMASSIGSGRGIVNIQEIQYIVDCSTIPIIIEGGLRSPSNVAQAMELGADAVLINTALARAQHSVMMAVAMKRAVEAGRLAFLAGMMPEVSERSQ